MKKIDDPKKQASIALKKAQTHIKKVLAMIEDDAYCINVIEQILAINGLLKSASEKILKQHLRTCFKHGINSPDPKHREKMINEVLDIVNLNDKHKIS
jgi:DNA-binding FrmR family transcriptional regulator